MNEELVINLAENIIGIVTLCLISGMLIGWYITFCHYRQKEREREAVESYKTKQKPSRPPKSYDEEQRDVLKELQRYCDSYMVTDEDKRWTYGNGVYIAERKFPSPNINKEEDEK